MGVGDDYRKAKRVVKKTGEVAHWIWDDSFEGSTPMTAQAHRDQCNRRAANKAATGSSSGRSGCCVAMVALVAGASASLYSLFELASYVLA